jgi:hypothetical protein
MNYSCTTISGTVLVGLQDSSGTPLVRIQDRNGNVVLLTVRQAIWLRAEIKTVLREAGEEKL